MRVIPRGDLGTVGEKGMAKIQTWERKAKGHFVLEIGY